MKIISVGNLDFGSTEAEIRSWVAPYGAIRRVSIIRDRKSSEPKGFGLVEMGGDAEGTRAIAQLTGRETDGRVLDVHAARPRLH